ncbi:phage tail tape measure protein [Methylosinus sp. Sm6]|uniref:phage tail tape measure protein n=1 Tax=Methylosinus sp. Sm6 TaxID=2866948 RepID=UPI001C99EC60|nr:phage tail tape measure protein [Methylosinus sp. Sm6]MBY6244030.1 phage tail tape measure protein [Methylosinus sp. Sm6]
MTDLDVAVRLRLVNLLSKEAKVAAKDIAGVGAAAGKLDGKAASRVAEALGKASSASDKLGVSLGKTSMAAEKIGGKATGRLTGELGKAWTVSAKLGGSLERTAAAANKAAQGVARIGQGSAAIDSTRRRIDQLTKSNIALGMSQRRLVSANMIAGMSRSGGGGIGGMAAAGAAGVALGRHGANKRQEVLREAASHITPNAYLIGAGGAVVAGAAIGGTAAALAATGAFATKEAIDRNKALAGVQKKVDLAPGATWDDLEKKIGKISRSLGMSYTEAADIFAQGGQGNVAYKDLDGFATLGAKVATAWDVGAREAAQMLTEVKAQTGWTIPQLQKFGDKVNGLGDVSAAAEKDIAKMWQRASAGAEVAGVSYDDSLAAMTALRSVGMQDEVASRFFGQLSSRLRTAASLKDDAQEAFKAIGLTAKQVQKGMEKDALGTMIDFLERLAKSKDGISVAKGVGGQEWFDEILLFKKSLPELKRLVDYLKSNQWENSLDKALTIDLGTTTKKLERAYQALLHIGAEAAKPILPYIDHVADKLTAASERKDKAAQASTILAKGVNDKLSEEEAQRLGSDPALVTRVAQQREAERRELATARYAREKVAVQVSSARAAGSGGLADIASMTAEMRKLDAQIAYLERRVELAKETPPETPAVRKEGLRGAFGRANPKLVEALEGKVKAYDTAMTTRDLFPNSEEARQKAQKLGDELVAIFQRVDLTPEARKIIDTFATAIGAQGSRVDAEAQAIRDRLQQILGAPIVVKIEPRLSGARGLGGSTGVGGGAAGGSGGPTDSSGGATPRKKTSSRGDVHFHVAQANFHGVKDVVSLHRQISAFADRRARAARDDALHDIDVG